MNEVGDALRSCMEQLLLVKEEKERLITEASTKISSEQNKAHNLRQKLEDANKRFMKVATENYNLRDIIDSKDKLNKELNESKAKLDEKLTEQTLRLEFTQNQCSSLQYEVRMLQKELEIRNKEREYDLRSVDAAQKQQKESIKKITALEAECQRLRTMVQKRLPGPAALAKMKYEVEHSGTASVQKGSRRPSTTVQPSLRVAQRRFVSEGYLIKLQELSDENAHLKKVLAEKESELQSMQLQYTDEACKLSIVQKQLKELSSGHDLEENHFEPWDSSEHFKVVKHRGSQIQNRRIAGSDMQLLVDLVEIDKLGIASRPSSAPHQCEPDESNTIFKTRPSEIAHQDINPGDIFDKCLDRALSDKYPEWIQDVLKLIVHKHQVNKISGDVILDKVTLALRGDSSVKGNGATNLSYDKAEIDIMVDNLIERVRYMIERSTKNNVMCSQSFMQEKSEFTAQLEYLYHVCSDVLDGKASLGKFIDEICLILEWIVNRDFLCHDGRGIVDNIINSYNGNDSLRALRVHEEHEMQSAKSEVGLGVHQEAHRELIETNGGHMLDEMLEDHSKMIRFAICKLDEEISSARQEQGDTYQEMQLAHYEVECAATDGCTDKLLDGDEMQLITNSAISAATEKLAECYDTITSLSNQLQALQSPANTYASGKEKLDSSCMTTVDVLSSKDATPEDSSSLRSEEVPFKKELGEPIATNKNLECDKDANVGHKADNNGSTQVVARPVIPKSPRPSVLVDMKKKRRMSLLSRLGLKKKA